VRGSIRQSSPARFITQEFRAVSDYDSALSWVAGVYLFSLERRLDPLDIENFPPATVTIPFPNTPLRIARSSTLINPLNRGFSYAPFGQAKLRLADKFSVLAGLRYTWERQKLDQNINGSTFNASAVFKNVSPMASLQYEPNDHINLYATYSTGFKSGVFNSAGGVSPGSTTQTPVKPEEIKNFELGLKSDVTAQLRVNTSVFHFRYTNQQVQVRQPNGVAVFINAGKSTVNGAETEITLRPSSEITVRATAAYLDAKYDSFPSAPVFVPTIIDGIPAGLDLITADNAGKHMIRAPKFTFGIAPEFHTPLGSGTLTVSGNAFHSSRYYFDSANLIPQPAYWNLNAKISCGFADDKVVVALFGTNLTQSDVLVAAAQGQFTVQAAYDSPRIIGVSIGTQF
jgi:iron complex outermembrane receptor protein